MIFNSYTSFIFIRSTCYHKVLNFFIPSFISQTRYEFIYTGSKESLSFDEQIYIYIYINIKHCRESGNHSRQLEIRKRPINQTYYLQTDVIGSNKKRVGDENKHWKRHKICLFLSHLLIKTPLFNKSSKNLNDPPN